MDTLIIKLAQKFDLTVDEIAGICWLTAIRQGFESEGLTGADQANRQIDLVQRMAVTPPEIDDRKADPAP
jgi:hypothetical protein